MYSQKEKSKENKSRAVAHSPGQNKSNIKQVFGFVDNRPDAVTQRKLQEITKDYNASQPIQKLEFQLGKHKPILKKNVEPIQCYPVVRGGTCLAKQFTDGSGVIEDIDGKLSGVSTQSNTTDTWQDLSSFFRNSKVGVAENTDITGEGGTLVHDGTRGNPYHATVSGLDAEKFEEIFTPTNPNPYYVKPKRKKKKK